MMFEVFLGAGGSAGAAAGTELGRGGSIRDEAGTERLEVEGE